MEKAAHQRQVLIHIEISDEFVEAVRPTTLTSTGEPQQFLLSDDGSLTIVAKEHWIEHPEIINVSTWSVR